MESRVSENKVLKQDSVKFNKSRIYFIDNIKVFLILLVIVHHVGQAYGPTGGFWYYKSSLKDNVDWLGSFFAVNASFFMGLFFMISGYFIPYSYDRNGKNKFLKDKIIRLGIPLIFGVLIIQPLQMYFYYSRYSDNMPISFIKYYQNIYLGIGGKPSWFKDVIGWPEMFFGHLWFIQHLLLYIIIYWVLRSVFTKYKIQTSAKNSIYLNITVITVLVTFVSAIVRIEYPIDKWIGLFGFIQTEVAHLPQYIILFITGIISFRKKWFTKFNKTVGYISLSIGLIMAMVVYLHTIIPVTVTRILYDNWTLYETFMSAFICWGLIVFFRERLNGTSNIIKFLVENAYAAYIFHVPIVLIMQYSFDKASFLGALEKFIIVSILSIIITFLLSYFIRKIPYVNKVI